MGAVGCVKEVTLRGGGIVKNQLTELDGERKADFGAMRPLLH